MGSFNDEWKATNSLAQWRSRRDTNIMLAMMKGGDAAALQRPITEDEIRHRYVSGLYTPNIPDAWRNLDQPTTKG
jgi:hypothetical protein